MSAERCCMIIDSQPVARLGIRHLLEPAWDIEELEDGSRAVELLTTVGRFEVAIVEMRSAGPDAPSGSATIRALLHHQPGLGVVAHGRGHERHLLTAALDAGASAYVSKLSPPETMLEAVGAVIDFDSFLDPSVERDSGKAPLTRRQRQVLQLFADGYSPDEVAKRLGLSTATVGTHARASLSRIGARDRAHAVAIALRSSLID